MRNSKPAFYPAAIACLIVGAFAFSSSAQEDQEPEAAAPETGGIRAMMTPEQFEAAGLNKLSAKELRSLTNWLQGDRETTVKAAEQKAVKSGRLKPTLVVSRIDGPFFGLTGNSIIKLQDGTRWKQANKSDRFKGPGGDNLGAAVFKAGLFGYRMRIEGTPEFYVDQVTK